MAEVSTLHAPNGVTGDRSSRRGAGWKQLAASVAVIALLGPGCTTVRSTHQPDFAASQPSGLTYFLPMRQARLTLTRAPIDLIELIRERDQKVVALAAAEGHAATAKSRREQAVAVLAALPLNAASRPDQVKVLELAIAQETVLEAVAAALRGEVLALRDRLTAAQTAGDNCQYAAKIELLPVQADRRARFVAELPHNYFRDDTVQFHVNPAGLLTSANVVAVDQTGQVLVEVAGVFGSLVGRSPEGSTKAFEEVARTPRCTGSPSLVRIFDPANGVDVGAVNTDLRRARFPFEIQVTAHGEALDGDSYLPAWPARPSGPADVRETRETPARTISGSGLYYRSPTPVLMALYRQADVTSGESNPTPIDAVIMTLPQAGPVSYLPMRASAFVKTTSDVQFADGSIASWSSERPSEVLSAARLPAQAIEAFSSALANVLTLRVETSDSREALGAQQVEEVVQQERNRLLLECVARAHRDNADVTPCLPETP